MERIQNGGGGGEFENASTKITMPKTMAMKKTNAGARDCNNDVDVDNGVDSNAHSDDTYNVNGGTAKLDDNKHGGANAARQ